MKITDKELLDAIWTNQLRLLSKEVLDNYIGGSISVCGESEFDYIHTSSEHRMRRDNVTKKISFKHLSSRLQKLASNGHISRDTYSDHLILTFMIPGEKAREAFKAARQFWLDHGVPTGYSKLKDDRSCANTTKDVDVDSLLPECEKMLMEKYDEKKV